MKKTSAVIGLVIILFTAGCKKDNEVAVNNLMVGAIEYTGDYPSPTVVSYLNNGSVVQVDAYPGQFIAFFREGITDENAHQIISSYGGTTISKIPAIRYYLVSVDTQIVSTFLSGMQTNSAVHAIRPNIVNYPKAGVIVFDACNAQHGTDVKNALQSCGGTLDRCSYVPADKAIGVPTSMLVYGITGFVNINNGGTTLINVSMNAGLTDVDWQMASNEDATKAIDNWGSNLYCLLNGIANIPSEKRKNLIVSLAVGNENMPIGNILTELRTLQSDNGTPLSNILRDNILLVGSYGTLISGIKANYSSIGDPDWVVLSNNLSVQGTSFSTPCAMAWIQRLINQNGMGAKQAMDLIKLAANLHPNQIVQWEDVEVLYQISTGKSYFSSISTSMMNYTNTSGSCTVSTDFTFRPSAYWGNGSGNLVIPAGFQKTISPPSICTLAEPASGNKIYNISLTGNNSNIYGSGAVKYFRLNGDCGDLYWHIPVVFTGAVNSNGQITGNLTMTYNQICGTDTILGNSKSIPITLYKQ